MTTADERHPSGTAYPWHDAIPSEAVAAGSRSSIQGTRAGLITRSIANIADLVVVTLLVAAGYTAVAATRFLLSPTTFTFPAPSPGTLLVLGLWLLALYFAITWAIGCWGCA
jgi:hypothetical protein